MKNLLASNLLSQAAAFFQAGDFSNSEKTYLQVLQQDPANSEALNILGVLSAQKYEFSKSIELLTKSLEINPLSSSALINRGLVFQQTGNLQAAIKDFKLLTSIAPNNPQTFYNLGNAYYSLGELENALTAYNRGVSLDPRNAALLNNRGNLYHDLHRTADAILDYQKAIVADPTYPDAYFNLGTCQHENKEYTEAISNFNQAIARNPYEPIFFIAQGESLFEIGDLAASHECFQAAINLDPTSLEAQLALAVAQIPKIYNSSNQLMEARSGFATKLREVKKFIEKNKGLSPNAIGNNQPFFLAYQPENNKDLLSTYGSICTEVMKNYSALSLVHVQSPNTSEPTRIGIVSNHIHNHSVWRALLKGFIQKLQGFEIYLFHIGSKYDAETEVAKLNVKKYFSNAGSFENWASIIQSSNIDALIYPEIGMDKVTTQLASLRLAPIQIATWGHPETTGLPTIDYFISAESFENPGAQANYSETLIQLPNLGVHYTPYLGDINKIDFSKLGITPSKPILLCAGSPFKYGPKFDDILIELALKLHDCQFVFFRFPDPATEILKKRMHTSFQRAELDPGKFIKHIPLLETENFYGLMKESCILLDTIGFSGFNTSIQAIECDLPIVTMRGQFLRSNLAAGILDQMSIHECIAYSETEYINIAINLIQNKNFREQIIQKIQKNKFKIFNDLDPVNKLSDFLNDVCR
ncbi:tetratricopeptide repeat protein [Polynucleobacter sp. MWH-UH23A]|uniref:O-linked N-acetylglucosamine transferase, SPINDLY family protein n=1 Tax=Polynucleobacter sp. MWH-UH23A TaxID=1855613 RepID=UPI0033651D7B